VAPIFRVLKEAGYINKADEKKAEEVSIEEGEPRVLIRLVKAVINSEYLL
jgi:hypothetical protein